MSRLFIYDNNAAPIFCHSLLFPSRRGAATNDVKCLSFVPSVKCHHSAVQTGTWNNGAANNMDGGRHEPRPCEKSRHLGPASLTFLDCSDLLLDILLLLPETWYCRMSSTKYLIYAWINRMRKKKRKSFFFSHGLDDGLQVLLKIQFYVKVFSDDELQIKQSNFIKEIILWFFYHISYDKESCKSCFF